MTDLHKQKAAEIYGVPEGQVTDAMRRVGKMVNYHLLYGVHSTLRDTVADNLKNAREGGYEEVDAMAPAVLAEDMRNYAAGMEGYSLDKIVVAILELRKQTL